MRCKTILRNGKRCGNSVAKRQILQGGTFSEYCFMHMNANLVDTTPRPDPTRNDRQRKRNQQKNEKARAKGWASWSEYETAVINGTVEIEQKGQNNG